MVHHRLLACVALLCWLFAGWSGMHEHVSYDGHDAALSLHMAIAADHAAHHADAHHVDEQHADAATAAHVDVDVNVDQLQSALNTFVKLDLPLLLSLTLLLVFQQRRRQAPDVFLFLKPPRYNSRLRPPLRAPPAIPA